MTVRGKRAELNLLEDYCDLKLGCEYCSHFNKRREEILHCDGTPVYDSEFKPKINETVDYEIKLWLDIDDGLMIQDHFKFNNSAANYGSFAKFAIKYCPWCGRKLERTKE